MERGWNEEQEASDVVGEADWSWEGGRISSTYPHVSYPHTDSLAWINLDIIMPVISLYTEKDFLLKGPAGCNIPHPAGVLMWESLGKIRLPVGS